MEVKICSLVVLFVAEPAYAELPASNFLQTECRGIGDFRITISLNTITHAADSAALTINAHEPGAYVYVPHKGVFVYDRVNVTFIADKETGLQSAFRLNSRPDAEGASGLLTCDPFLPLSKNKPSDW